MKYTVLFSLCGVTLTAYAVMLGGFAWILLWPGAAFLIVGLAYCGIGPRVFGKRPNGSLAWWSTILLLPYLVYLWTTWHCYRLLTKEPPFHELLPEIWIGRRLLAHEYPPQIAQVIDLTCEFAEPAAVVCQRDYRCLPVLDASVPNASHLECLLDEIAPITKPIYIHCALGHGRTALVAAALLVAKGACQNADDAVAMVRSRRPKADLHACQQQALEMYVRRLAERYGNRATE